MSSELRQRRGIINLDMTDNTCAVEDLDDVETVDHYDDDEVKSSVFSFTSAKDQYVDEDDDEVNVAPSVSSFMATRDAMLTRLREQNAALLANPDLAATIIANDHEVKESIDQMHENEARTRERAANAEVPVIAQVFNSIVTAVSTETKEDESFFETVEHFSEHELAARRCCIDFVFHSQYGRGLWAWLENLSGDTPEERVWLRPIVKRVALTAADIALMTVSGGFMLILMILQATFFCILNKRAAIVFTLVMNLLVLLNTALLYLFRWSFAKVFRLEFLRHAYIPLLNVTQPVSPIYRRWLTLSFFSQLNWVVTATMSSDISTLRYFFPLQLVAVFMLDNCNHHVLEYATYLLALPILHLIYPFGPDGMMWTALGAVLCYMAFFYLDHIQLPLIVKTKIHEGPFPDLTRPQNLLGALSFYGAAFAAFQPDYVWADCNLAYVFSFAYQLPFQIFVVGLWPLVVGIISLNRERLHINLSGWSFWIFVTTPALIPLATVCSHWIMWPVFAVCSVSGAMMVISTQFVARMGVNEMLNDPGLLVRFERLHSNFTRIYTGMSYGDFFTIKGFATMVLRAFVPASESSSTGDAVVPQAAEAVSNALRSMYESVTSQFTTAPSAPFTTVAST